jgi:site-specific recombinase XerD
MTVFYTNSDSLNASILVDGKPLQIGGEPYSLPAIARRALRDQYVPDGMPFFLDTDGQYKSVINAFLLSLANSSVSLKTWRGYAYDLRQFEQFLLTETKCESLQAAGPDEFDLYFRKRRIYERFSDTKKTIESSTWRRQMAAFSRFTEWWAEKNGGIDVFAARKKAVRRNIRRHILRAGHDTVPVLGIIKSISISDYKTFRDKGLRELGGSGSQTTLRNVAFAELAVTTGIRLTENSALLLKELPIPEQKAAFLKRHLPMTLGGKTTKGQRPRSVLVPRRVLRDVIAPYLDEDRGASIARAEHYDRYTNLHSMIRVRGEGSNECQAATGRAWKSMEYKDISIARRKLMYSVDHRSHLLAPSMLWLQESGLPASPACFNAVFSRARAHLEKEHGIILRVSPHTLRHTFAIYKLTQLIEATCENIENLRHERKTSSPQAYNSLIADPLTELQRLLGHASQATTRIYLTYVEQASEIIDGEVEGWAELSPAPAGRDNVNE